MRTKVFASVGVLLLGLCLTRMHAAPRQFHAAYLVAYLLWLGFSLGAAALWMLHHLVGGQWGLAAQPAFRAATRTLPLMLVLFLPHAFAIPALYPWGEQATAIPAMGWYLNPPFFYARAAVCFAVWLFFAALLERRQGPGEALSALGLFLYVVTISVAAFDWVLSLDLANRSTIFGLLVLAGQLIGTLALTIFIMLAWPHPTLPTGLASQTLQDLGNLTLMAVMLWAYFTYSQLVITWSGNMREEVVWYGHRLGGGWPGIALFLGLFNFAVPFLMLLFRSVKRRREVMAPLALVLMFTQWVNTFWLILPSVTPRELRLNWLHLAAPLAVGALWLTVFRMAWQRTLAVPSEQKGGR